MNALYVTSLRYASLPSLGPCLLTSVILFYLLLTGFLLYVPTGTIPTTSLFRGSSSSFLFFLNEKQKQDVETLSGNNLGSMSRQSLLKNMTNRDVILSNQTDDNDVLTLLAKCNVVMRKPAQAGADPMPPRMPPRTFVSRYSIDFDNSGAAVLSAYDGENQPWPPPRKDPPKHTIQSPPVGKDAPLEDLSDVDDDDDDDDEHDDEHDNGHDSEHEYKKKKMKKERESSKHEVSRQKTDTQPKRKANKSTGQEPQKKKPVESKASADTIAKVPRKNAGASKGTTGGKNKGSDGAGGETESSDDQMLSAFVKKRKPARPVGKPTISDKSVDDAAALRKKDGKMVRGAPSGDPMNVSDFQKVSKGNKSVTKPSQAGKGQDDIVESSEGTMSPSMQSPTREPDRRHGSVSPTYGDGDDEKDDEVEGGQHEHHDDQSNTTESEGAIRQTDKMDIQDDKFSEKAPDEGTEDMASITSSDSEGNHRFEPSAADDENKGKIHVGLEHQVPVKPFNGPEPLVSRKPKLVWKQGRASDDTMQSFLDKAAEVLGEYAKQNKLLVEEPYLPLPFERTENTFGKDELSQMSLASVSTASLVSRKRNTLTRECKIDALLETLNDENGDAAAALERVRASPRDYLTAWTKTEKQLFDSGFRKYAGSLRMISKGVAMGKDFKDVVDFHYRFKIPDQFRRYQNKKLASAKRIIGFLDQRRPDDATIPIHRPDEQRKSLPKLVGEPIGKAREWYVSSHLPVLVHYRLCLGLASFCCFGLCEEHILGYLSVSGSTCHRTIVTHYYQVAVLLLVLDPFISNDSGITGPRRMSLKRLYRWSNEGWQPRNCCCRFRMSWASKPWPPSPKLSRTSMASPLLTSKPERFPSLRHSPICLKNLWSFYRNDSVPAP